ncbi:MAG: hypothetical protein K1566_17735 [Candidatus Thiodiazotropha sp. (ex. Lucinisca nassula)]|nr:hypothetical protein [Candidatus Thiodiazotropha sp. (ex. Lucinisca nassula)]
MLTHILQGDPLANYGVRVEAPMSLVDDPGADTLDALLCAIQAARDWRQKDSGFDAPDELDALEGWIADPMLAA